VGVREDTTEKGVAGDKLAKKKNAALNGNVSGGQGERRGTLEPRGKQEFLPKWTNHGGGVGFGRGTQKTRHTTKGRKRITCEKRVNMSTLTLVELQKKWIAGGKGMEFEKKRGNAMTIKGKKTFAGGNRTNPKSQEREDIGLRTMENTSKAKKERGQGGYKKGKTIKRRRKPRGCVAQIKKKDNVSPKQEATKSWQTRKKKKKGESGGD